MEFGRMQSGSLSQVVDLVKDKIQTYDIEVNPVALTFFYLKSDNPTMDQKFDELRKELVPMGFIPFLREDVENVLIVTVARKRHYLENKVNVILFAMTLVATVYWGSIYASNFSTSETQSILYGFLFFAGPLLLILGLHELGHFIVAKRLSVEASFPFFIPFPLYLGTFGAFISLRDPIPNRRAMVEIGAAGPIVGFLSCIPFLFLANYLQQFFPATGNNSMFTVNFPYLYDLLGLHSGSAPVFPMVLAVWVGFLATAMNLLPLSQLDGGHIARGILGGNSNILGYGIVGFLVFIGLAYNYPGWIFLAMFGMVMGLSHPPPLDDYSKINFRDAIIAAVTVAMFLLSFTAKPIIP